MIFTILIVQLHACITFILEPLQTLSIVYELFSPPSCLLVRYLSLLDCPNNVNLSYLISLYSRIAYLDLISTPIIDVYIT